MLLAHRLLRGGSCPPPMCVWQRPSLGVAGLAGLCLPQPFQQRPQLPPAPRVPPPLVSGTQEPCVLHRVLLCDQNGFPAKEADSLAGSHFPVAFKISVFLLEAALSAQRSMCCCFFDSKRLISPTRRALGRDVHQGPVPLPQPFKDLRLTPSHVSAELRITSSVRPRRPACSAPPPSPELCTPSRPPLTALTPAPSPSLGEPLPRWACSQSHAARVSAFECSPCRGWVSGWVSR